MAPRQEEEVRVRAPGGTGDASRPGDAGRQGGSRAGDAGADHHFAFDRHAEAAVKPRLRVAGTALSLLALFPWVTGLLVSGAVVAPVVFSVIPDPSEAGAVMQPIFLRLDRVYLTAAILLLAGEGLHGAAIRGEVMRWHNLLRLPLALAMAGLTAWGGLSIHPRMEALRTGGFVRGEGEAWAEFDALHRLSEAVAKTEAVAGLALLLLIFMGAWRFAVRAARAPRS